MCAAGDTITDVGIVASVSTFDAVNSNNQIAFQLTTTTGTQAIVRDDNFVPILAVPPESQGNQSLPALSTSVVAGGGWKTDPYAGGGTVQTGSSAGQPYTIGNSGCTLTALSMALNYAGIATNPRDLNNLLTYTASYIVGGVLTGTSGYGGATGHFVNLGAATKIAAESAAATTGQPNNIVFQDCGPSNPATDSDSATLTALLSSSRSPVIVAVDPNIDGNGNIINWGHYVLVTGVEGSLFTINDPGNAQHTTLDPATDYFQIRGYVADPVDESEIEVSAVGATDGVRISVTTASGQVTGLDPATGMDVNQIPGSVEYLDGLEADESDSAYIETDDVVDISTPVAGQYTITVTGGVSSEPYTIDIGSIASDGNVEPAVTETGNASPGSSTTYQYAFNPVSTLPLISISDVTEPKGHSGTAAFDFTVSLSSQPSQPVTLDYSTADDSGSVADNDYQSATGSLTFTSGGSLSQTIEVLVNGNTINEPDETFFVDLTNISNAALGNAVGVGTIQNDATPISISDVAQYGANNGTTPFTFTVSLASASTLPVSVDYATADGTATLAAGDYQAQGGTLTFNPGETSQTVTILVNGNSQPHGNETFFVNLANPVNGIVAANGQQGVGTILADNTGGTSYYVNGPSTVGDVFCTAPGSNSNNGLTPATPVASLSALLSMYTFHPGDTIYVDTATYNFARNITLGPAFSGVRIIGAGPQEVAPSLDGSAVLADKPVAFWRLGDAGGIAAVDATGNGYDGTYVGDVTPISNAPTNDGAALFAGPGSYVTVPYSPALNPPQFTIEAWVYLQPGAGFPYETILNMNGAQITYRSGNITFDAYSSYYQASAPLPAGVWNDVVATFDSSADDGSTDTASLYLNGTLVGSASAEVPVETGNGPLQIGPANDLGLATWNVGICEVALYDDVLSTARFRPSTPRQFTPAPAWTAGIRRPAATGSSSMARSM